MMKKKRLVTYIHPMFCGLHVLHNLDIYAEKSLIDWEKIIEEGTTHGGLKNSSNSRPFDLLYGISNFSGELI